MIVIGSYDAIVKIKIFSSLTCPHCANFHMKVVPEIKKEYELIYSSDDIELLERFINKYKDNEDVWWFVARIENKIKILKN